MAEHNLHRVSFPTLDDLQVATLATFDTREAWRNGELLFQAVTRDYTFFVVERGAVKIVEHSSGEPKPVTIHAVHELGNDVDLLTSRPALISAVARGDTEVFEISPGRCRSNSPIRHAQDSFRGTLGRKARARRSLQAQSLLVSFQQVSARIDQKNILCDLSFGVEA